MLDVLGLNWMRPRIVKPEFERGIFGSGFGGSFDNSAKRVAHFPSVFAVSIIDAPELLFLSFSSSCILVHGRSSAQLGFSKM